MLVLVFVFVCINITKSRVHSSNHCIASNMLVRLYAVYLKLILPHIGRGTMKIADVVASHAFRSLQRSSLNDGVNSPCPNVANTVEIAIRP